MHQKRLFGTWYNNYIFRFFTINIGVCSFITYTSIINMLKEVIKQQKELCLRQKKWFEEFKLKEKLVNRLIKYETN